MHLSFMGNVVFTRSSSFPAGRTFFFFCLFVQNQFSDQFSSGPESKEKPKMFIRRHLNTNIQIDTQAELIIRQGRQLPGGPTKRASDAYSHTVMF